MTWRDVDALAALDFACWEDSEQGGEGWVRPRVVAEHLAVTLCWAYQLLARLVHQGLVERMHRKRLWHYAPTEQGADYLRQLEKGTER